MQPMEEVLISFLLFTLLFGHGQGGIHGLSNVDWEKFIRNLSTGFTKTGCSRYLRNSVPYRY